MKYILILLALTGCATPKQPCIDYLGRMEKYVRQYTRDDITVHEFIIFNEDLDILMEIGIPNCKVVK